MLENNWRKDLTKSAKAFIEIVWPQISSSSMIEKGELIAVESVTAKGFTKQLDILAGIDCWQIMGEGMRGIASRVQFGNTDYRSFTIRYKRPSGIPTEYEKRKLAIHNNKGLLYPYLTIQAYLTKDNKFMSAGIIKTKDLFMCLDNKCFCGTRMNPDGVSFKFIPWIKIKNLKIEIDIITKESKILIPF